MNSGYRDATGTQRSRIYMFSGSPTGVRLVGDGGPGTLPVQPNIGVRTLGSNSFRVTTSEAPSGAPVLLVIGFQAPPIPVINLPALGFTGCTLYPAPLQVGFSFAGTAGLDAGYALHDFQRPLVSATTLGALPMYAQWVVLGDGALWPGGVSAALEMRWR